MKNDTLLIIALLAGGAYLYFHGSKSAAQKRQWLIDWGNGSTTDTQGMKDFFAGQIAIMSDSEVSDAYTLVHDHFLKGIPVPAGSDLMIRLNALSSKYNIFT